MPVEHLKERGALSMSSEGHSQEEIGEIPKYKSSEKKRRYLQKVDTGR